MLGRPVGLESEPGVGSRFWVVLSSDVLIAAITNLHLHLHRPEYAAR
jgi:hypothetical protein